ncbi:hypothetical protein PENSPDRAFT_596960 [Peniophora sp. CONT]|nr:hypothetical protein PENSPDRAFT_596960 [Peniophora sp. CONT]
MVRAQPKIFQILVKSNKLTIFLTFPNSTTIAEVKTEVLSALLDEVTESVDVFKPTSVQDFALAVERPPLNTGNYETVEDDKRLIEVAKNWERMYVQFRDPDSGELQPVIATLPPLDDDEELEMDIDEPPVVESEVKKGKRKA